MAHSASFLIAFAVVLAAVVVAILLEVRARAAAERREASAPPRTPKPSPYLRTHRFDVVIGGETFTASAVRFLPNGDVEIERAIRASGFPALLVAVPSAMRESALSVVVQVFRDGEGPDSLDVRIRGERVSHRFADLDASRSDVWTEIVTLSQTAITLHDGKRSGKLWNGCQPSPGVSLLPTANEGAKQATGPIRFAVLESPNPVPLRAVRADLLEDR